MRSMRIRIGSAGLLLVLLNTGTPAVHADRLVLKSGKVLEGQVVVERPRSVVIKTDTGLTLEILKADLVQQAAARPAATGVARTADPAQPQAQQGMPAAPPAEAYLPMIQHAQAIAQQAHERKREMTRHMLQAEDMSPAQIEQAINDPGSPYYVPPAPSTQVDLKAMQDEIQKATSTGDFSAILKRAADVQALAEQKRLETERAIREMEEGGY